MKIGIDISMLVYRGSGVAEYTYNFVKSLLKYDRKNTYILFYSSLRIPDNFYYLDELRKLGATVFDYPFPPRLLKFFWNRKHLLPIERLIGKVDVFFSSDFLRPPLKEGTLGITTIHDMTWKIFPQYHTEDIVNAHEIKMEKTLKFRDVIFVDSENTKADLLKLYPKAQRNYIKVLYPGISEKYKIIKDKKKIRRILKKYKVGSKKFLLYVGAIEPRKNLAGAIRVYSRIIQDPKYSDLDFLIVGRAGWKNEKVFNLIKRLKLQKRVKFVGFVEDKDLPYFYSAAFFFVYLSKYEGFGLPPLEAALCGCPSLLLNNSSIREIFSGKYPLLKNRITANQIKKILDRRDELSKKARRIARVYKWKLFVKELLEIIE